MDEQNDINETLHSYSIQWELCIKEDDPCLKHFKGDN